MNILLVEDDDFDASMIERAMRKSASSAVIVRARDGIEAREIIGTDTIPQPFFVLLDVNMPRMNGLEFLASLRAGDEQSDCIVFMFTTSESPSDIDEAYRQFANGYFVKPSDMDGMLKLLTTLQEFWSVCEPPRASPQASRMV